jgi:hypothetical protein
VLKDALDDSRILDQGDDPHLPAGRQVGPLHLGQQVYGQEPNGFSKLRIGKPVVATSQKGRSLISSILG